MTLGRQFETYAQHVSDSLSTYTLGRSRDYGYGGAADFEVHGRLSVYHSPKRTEPASYIGWQEMGEQRGRNQLQLFGMYGGGHTPAESKVGFLEFTEKARASAIPLLGRAELDAKERHGTLLSASSDRSEHSERLVSRLADRGVGEFSERTNNNYMDFMQPDRAASTRLGDKVPPEKMDEARKYVRGVLRSTRRPRSTGEQQSLF